jgi:hypothetical protein
MHFAIFVFHREEHFSFDAGWCRRGECGANVGRICKINKNNRVADYKMQM